MSEEYDPIEQDVKGIIGLLIFGGLALLGIVVIFVVLKHFKVIA
jgi:hypothetical protein